jgi:hypothetical protein
MKIRLSIYLAQQIVFFYSDIVILFKRFCLTINSYYLISEDF